MSELVVCPECHQTAPMVVFCETCGAVWDPPPLSPVDMRAACETYLRENGWEQRGPLDKWVDPLNHARWRQLGEAVEDQLGRDGIGGAT